eukprot:SAG22_NODE_13756_length_396_cov_0.616162_1_plen_52_part_10
MILARARAPDSEQRRGSGNLASQAVATARAPRKRTAPPCDPRTAAVPAGPPS